MSIETNIFKKAVVDFDKLNSYGFNKKDNCYLYEKKFLNDAFKAIVSVSNKGIVSGKVIDLDINEEYFCLRTDMSGEFVNKVRNEYKKILIDIKNKCFEEKYFIGKQANRITECIKNKFDVDPEFLWDKLPGCGVFRSFSSGKWFGIIMNISLSKIGAESGESECLNVKLNRVEILELLKRKGFYKAYHMNKKDWISIVLNDTLSDNEVMNLIDESYNLVSK